MFPNEKQKGSESRWEGRGEGTRVEAVEAVIRIYNVKKEQFSIKMQISIYPYATSVKKIYSNKLGIKIWIKNIFHI